jgi:hypothetical protein
MPTVQTPKNLKTKIFNSGAILAVEASAFGISL